ncbi:MAG: MFS transporter, partial [Streptomycetaceae bacterium]|nr:MFS transporter [Streptomycetaceae bacterium]
PGWEWIFFVNVPVGAAVFAGVLALVATDGRDAHTAGADTASTSRRPRLDLPGAILATGATALLILGVTRSGDDDWSEMRVWLPLAGAAVAYALFALVQHRTREPLVPLGLLTRRPMVAGAFTMLVATALLVSCFFLGSMYLQHTVGLSAFRTGLVFLPVAVAVTVGAHVGGRLVGAVGPRWVAVGAMAVAAVGYGLLSRVPANGEVMDVLPGLVVAAVGIGPAFVAATTTAMAHVCPTQAGVTSGVVNTFHELGAALGVALASATAAASLGPAVTADGYEDAFLGGVLIALAAAAVTLGLAPRGRLPEGSARHVH